MSEDSSSDEDISKFQEAVDIKLTQAFSSNILLVNEQKNSTQQSTTVSISMPSLRKPDKEDNFCGDHRSLQVTPEFQKFVAKKLETTLERYLHEIEAASDSTENIKSKKKRKKSSKSTGIKLFKTSADLIGEFVQDTCESDNKIQEHNRYMRNNCYNEKEELKKVKAVVVDSDLILSHKELESWSKDVKGEVMRVKKTSDENVFSVEQKSYVPPEAWTGRVMR